MRQNNDNHYFDESDPDVFLMLEFKSGDRASFENLMRKYYKRIFNVIYRMTGSLETAEDLSQEVFLRVYQSSAQYQPCSKFQTWLYAIANDVLQHALRGRKRFSGPFKEKSFLNNDDGLDDQEDGKAAAGMRELARLHERVQAVQEGMAGLAGQQRIAVILYRYERMSYDEIAQTLGVTIETVKALLSNAREHLRRVLGSFIERIN